MSDKYDHLGTNCGPVDALLDVATLGLWSAIGTNECVQDKDTGDLREVFRAGGQSVGEAIANGQFTDKDR